MEVETLHCLIDEAIKEWDKLEGKLPPFRDFLLDYIEKRIGYASKNQESRWVSGKHATRSQSQAHNQS